LCIRRNAVADDLTWQQLIDEWNDVVTDPRPSMADWGTYFRLIEFKLSRSLPNKRAHLVDSMLVRMRDQLTPILRSQFARWRVQRISGYRHPVASPGYSSHGDVDGEIGGGDPAFVYCGTIRGLLPKIRLHGFSPDRWRLSSQFTSPSPPIELVAHWREAEVHAVLAHLKGPEDRVVPACQPVILRIPLDPDADSSHQPQLNEIGITTCAAIDLSGLELWRLGEDPRPHWGPFNVGPVSLNADPTQHGVVDPARTTSAPDADDRNRVEAPNGRARRFPDLKVRSAPSSGLNIPIRAHAGAFARDNSFKQRT
jgi:hypothetical protein